MGSCTRRHFLLSTCFLQMITIIERQAFDFLGYMWAPIFVNFFQILFIIFGFYGAYHFRIKYIITYLLWSILWIGWNSFLICFYLNVGELDKESDLLNLGTGSVSWFEINGYGCKPMYPTNITSDDPFRPIRPERVDDCLLEYPMIEVIHSGIQCTLAFIGILGAILISYIFLDEDDRFDFMNGDAKSPQHTVVHPMYVSYTSIPTSASATMLSKKDIQNSHNPNSYHAHHNNHNYNHHPNHHKQHHHQQQQNDNNNRINNTHHLQEQQHVNNNNTFLIHCNIKYTNASKNSTLNSSRNNTISSSRNKIYDSKSNKVAAAKSVLRGADGAVLMMGISNGMATPNAMDKKHQQQPKYYDDSTVKADHQLFTNNCSHKKNNNNDNSCNGKQLTKLSLDTFSPIVRTSSPLSKTLLSINGEFYQQKQQEQKQLLQSDNPFHCKTNALNNTNTYSTKSSLSNASLQKYSAQDSIEFNSNSNSNMSASLSSSPGVGLAGDALKSINYSINNNNNTSRISRCEHINNKPKPTKSLSYSSFINGGAVATPSSSAPLSWNKLQKHLAELRICQNSNDSLKRVQNKNQDHGIDNIDNIFALQNFKEDGLSYVHFQKPVPDHLYFSRNNNPYYASLNSSYTTNNSNTNNDIIGCTSNEKRRDNIISKHTYTKFSPNNSSQAYQTTKSSLGLPFGNHPLTRDNSQLFLNNNNDLLLERHNTPALRPPQSAPVFLSSVNHALFQQNGQPFQLQQQHHSNQRSIRPSNIPLPTVPHSAYAQPQHTAQSSISSSVVTPPPPPAPRPHLFAPLSGHTPEITERYAMPTQYVPRSPVASRITRRQRQRTNNDHSHLANTSANFCDQIRDAPPGYIDTGFNIVRAKSHECLTAGLLSSAGRQTIEKQSATPDTHAKDPAPQVNLHSSRSSDKTRPRSYCNSHSSASGEVIIRGVSGGCMITGLGGGGINADYS